MPLDPTLDAVIDAVEAAVEAVATITAKAVPVYDSPVEYYTISDVKASLLDNENRVHFYEIEAGTSQEREKGQRGRFVAVHRIMLHGYHTVVQSTISAGKNAHRIFLEEGELVRDAIRSSSAIFGTPEDLQESERTSSMVDRTPTMKGGVLCWHNVIELFVEATAEVAF